MGPKVNTVGGGPATGLANDWVGFLDKGLNTGTFGAGRGAGPGAIDSTTGIAGILNEVLSGGAGKFGDALQSIIGRRQNLDIANLHQRYGATSVGTPGAFAESSYRAQAAPESALAIGNFQLKALEPILAMIQGLSMKGLPQAETLIQPGFAQQALGALPGLATGTGSILKGLAANKAVGGGSTPPEQTQNADDWWSNFMNSFGNDVSSPAMA